VVAIHALASLKECIPGNSLNKPHEKAIHMR